MRSLLVTLLLLALVPALALAAPARQQAQVHPGVWEALQAEGEVDVLVLLRERADLGGAAALLSKQARGRYVYDKLRELAGSSQRGLRAMLEARQAQYRPFYIVNGLQVRADGNLVQALATRPEVEQIRPNPWVRGVANLPSPESGSRTPQGIELNLVRVGADEVWAQGYTGQGIVVAGNDTGIQWDHPALIESYREPQAGYGRHDFNWHDAISHQPVPYDDHSHGTHTLGIIVGDDGGSNQIGMAPGARWIGCKNMDSRGYGTPASYLECFEFFLAPYASNDPTSADPALAPDVVNNSWACPPSEGCDAGTLEAAVAALRQAGIVVVAAAGNYGPACGSVQYPPGLYRQSLSIGAFSHVTGEIARFSSRGPVTYGGSSYTKPDLTAPGMGIRSCLPGGRYGSNSGTSMAAPHVAGAVALLLSTAPGLAGQVDSIEQILTRTAEARPSTEGCGGEGPEDVPNNTWGWGILDIRAAVESVTGRVQGSATDASDGRPISGARVTVDAPARPDAVTDGDGNYALALASGTYSLAAQISGYLPQTITNVVVITGLITVQDLSLTPWLRVYLPFIVKQE